MQTCRGPLEVELEACRDGLILAMNWSPLPFVVEGNCTEAVKLITSQGVDRSPLHA
jgi:hypothetical protein